MTENKNTPKDSLSFAIPEMSFRKIGLGKIYDILVAGQSVEIGTISKVHLILDEENLGLEKVTRESLDKGWERNKKAWIQHCADLEIPIDPFMVYSLNRVETKAVDVLGSPKDTKPMERVLRMMSKSKDESIRLSDMKGAALCSEFALLEAYMLQKLGFSANLVAGAIYNPDTQYNEGHMYTWVGSGINGILEGTLASKDENPALMLPIVPATLESLETGQLITCKRMVRKGSRYTYSLNDGFS